MEVDPFWNTAERQQDNQDHREKVSGGVRYFKVANVRVIVVRPRCSVAGQDHRWRLHTVVAYAAIFLNS